MAQLSPHDDNAPAAFANPLFPGQTRCRLRATTGLVSVTYSSGCSVMLPNNLTVRLATLADAAEIATLSRELIETGLGWSWTRARVGRNIASAATTTLVACDRE